MDSVKSLMRQAKGLAHSEVENKVREATSNENWGASSTLMSEIAMYTRFANENYQKLLAMLWKRMFSKDQPRHTLKALLLMEYLLRNGDERFIEDARYRTRDVEELQHYRSFDEDTGEDRGGEVRNKAKALLPLLKDDVRLAEERSTAAQLAKENKFKGYSNDSFDHRYRPEDHPAERKQNNYPDDPFGSAAPATRTPQQPSTQSARTTPQQNNDPFGSANIDPFAATKNDPFGEDDWSASNTKNTTANNDPFAQATFDPFADAATSAPKSKPVQQNITVPTSTVNKSPSPVPFAAPPTLQAPPANTAPRRASTQTTTAPADVNAAIFGLQDLGLDSKPVTKPAAAPVKTTSALDDLLNSSSATTTQAKPASTDPFSALAQTAGVNQNNTGFGANTYGNPGMMGGMNPMMGGMQRPMGMPMN